MRLTKIVNGSTGTEPYWIALLTEDYSAYVRAHVRTESWQAVTIWGHTPGIHLLTQG